MAVDSTKTSSSKLASGRASTSQSFQADSRPSTPTSATMGELAPFDSAAEPQTDNLKRQQIETYLHLVSGQLRKLPIHELEHGYAKPWNTHPDLQLTLHPARFLFMKHFPRHLTKQSYPSGDDDIIDIMSYEEPKKIPLLTPRVSVQLWW